MKSKISFVIIALSTAILLSMGVLLVIAGEKENRASLYENRMLQGFPELSSDNIFSGKMASEFENYLLDGFLLRNIVIDFSEGCIDVLSAQTEKDIQLLEGGKDEIEGVESTPGESENLEFDINPENFQQENSPAHTDDTIPETSETYPDETDTDNSNEQYGFYYVKQNGDLVKQFFTDIKSIEKTAQAINAYREELPEDGNVFYMSIPLTANYTPVRNNSEYAGWYSTVEDAMSQYTVEGVHVVNIPEVLNPHIQEEIYFPLDHHWSALGAWYAVEELMNIQGLPMTPYEEYDYLKMTNIGKWFDVLYPLQELSVSKVYNKSTEYPAEFMNYRMNNYMVYLTGVIKPWTKIETGFSTGRKALIVGGSFANVFAPYLVPYYDEVHMVDIREVHYSPKEAGGSLSELIKYHGIDDVYFVMSFATGPHTATSYERLEKCLYE